MRNIVAYCRSAREEPGTPSSAYRQARAIRSYARRKGWTVGKTYIDPDMNGMTLKRPGLGMLLADCRAGKVRTIIMRDPERLSRDTSQLCALLCVFLKAGVRIEFSTKAGRSSFAWFKMVLSVLTEIEKMGSVVKGAVDV